MKQYIKKLSMVLVLMVFAVIVAMTVPTEAKAAYKSSPYGKVIKCGSYYIKRNKTGIYKSKKKTSGFKLVVKAATSKIKDNGSYAYGFTSDGTTIYYAVNDDKTNKGIIYSIKATGKSKKTVYKAKHQVNVYYSYGGKIVYKSDVIGDKNFAWDYMYCLNPKSTAKTKYKNMCYSGDSSYDSHDVMSWIFIKEFTGKYAVILTQNEEGWNDICLWDIDKMKENYVGASEWGFPDKINNLYYIKDGYFYYIYQWEDYDIGACVVKHKIGSDKETKVTKEYKGWGVSLKPGQLIYENLKGKKCTVKF